MNINQLSKRLMAVAARIPAQAVMADIGSDHAYLPCYAINKGLAVKAIAGEVADGPLQAAEQQVKAAGLEGEIDVRKGNGLEVISAGEVDCVTIAGMGGTLITSILNEGKEKLEGVKRLVLQPNLRADHIRKWLIENDWELIDEVIMEEDGKIYEILTAEKGDAEKPYSTRKELKLLTGPMLLAEKNEAFLKKWKREADQLEVVLKNLEKAGNQQAAKEKKQSVLRELQLIKEAISSEESERT
ncbi:tRNA (adenine(22)-N(1))-methyltransferase [Pseudobacillus wudalianchiensis]|uniref:SAM-dependent methyltransferase n=1 Tax=Pseudobacillus wudalianchiensis TaxID=1743143 RepID=A0A1B9B8W2_9BACI|nr:tRNA (adenine(22)-N(1))-methyltransferase TrmK [Bacillus wudalianchiensis]OCA92527.1 SAM-dependent methyltransferase [Bacillus wudalianchiensis]